MTRTGKIARLPRSIREELNRRLDDGQQGAALVDWLNAQDEVKRVLDRDFAGRPINEQNLSEWRQGGFVDWQQRQEAGDWIRSLTGNTEDLADETGIMPLSDHISTMAALSLGRLLPLLAAEALDDTSKRHNYWRFLRELSRLRRDDFESAQMRTHFEHLHAQRCHRKASQAQRA